MRIQPSLSRTIRLPGAGVMTSGFEMCRLQRVVAVEVEVKVFEIHRDVKKPDIALIFNLSGRIVNRNEPERETREEVI